MMKEPHKWSRLFVFCGFFIKEVDIPCGASSVWFKISFFFSLGLLTVGLTVKLVYRMTRSRWLSSTWTTPQSCTWRRWPNSSLWSASFARKALRGKVSFHFHSPWTLHHTIKEYKINTNSYFWDIFFIGMGREDGGQRYTLPGRHVSPLNSFWNSGTSIICSVTVTS